MTDRTFDPRRIYSRPVVTATEQTTDIEQPSNPVENSKSVPPTTMQASD